MRRYPLGVCICMCVCMCERYHIYFLNDVIMNYRNIVNFVNAERYNNIFICFTKLNIYQTLSKGA